MDIHFTARKFKARDEIKSRAIEAVKNLEKYYDGILRCDIILSYERSTQSVKMAEINLRVFGSTLTAKERSEDFLKSIDLAIGKLERRLSKYKTKIMMKDKKQLRSVKEKVVRRGLGEDES